MQQVILNGLLVVAPDDAVVTDTDPYIHSYRISKLAFRNRFTFSEKVSIELAAINDLEVRVLIKDQDSAEFIDLERVDTIAGVALLVNKGLITMPRSNEILSLTIQPHEIFKG